MRMPLLLANLVCAILFVGCGSAERESVVLYTSQDQFYAEPILQAFTEETGIEVRPVFDTESAKTAGLANRLRQESRHPQCDVFWSNEEMHARLLINEGVLPLTGAQWLGYRTRRLVVNTNLLPLAQVPTDLRSLTNEAWKGKIVLAYPLYGTTSSHFLALRQRWGHAEWERWCRGLKANRAKVVDGNSMVVKLVGAGEAWIGLTDSDDIAAGKRQGLPVEAAPLTSEMLVIPNSLCEVSPRSNPSAKRLIEFLSRPETIEQLSQLGALEGRDPAGLGMKIPGIRWEHLSRELSEANEVLKGIFLRS